MNEREYKTNFIKHNIDIQLLTIYKNFVNVVYNYVVKTYVGDEFMTDELKDKHYDFCWSSAAKDFDSIGFDFINMTTAKDYFKKLIFRLYYSSNMKNINNGYNCHSIFHETINVLFEFKPTYSDQMEIINKIYKLFNDG